MRENMGASALIFDIETTGLKQHDRITVICAISQPIATGEDYTEHRFNILEAKDSREESVKLCKDFLALANGAEKLVAYNGISFDIPFVIRWANSLGLVVDKYEWESKTIDFYKIILRQTGTHFKMQKLCECNALEVGKSGTGLDAVRWAREGNWEMLLLYCMQDVVVLRALLLRACAEGLCVSVLRGQASVFEDSMLLLRLGHHMQGAVFERQGCALETQQDYRGVFAAVCDACEGE